MLILISTCISINLILYLMYLSLDTNLSASARNIVFFEYFRSFYTFRVTFIKCRLSQYSRNSEKIVSSCFAKNFYTVNRVAFVNDIESYIESHTSWYACSAKCIEQILKKNFKEKDTHIYIYIYIYIYIHIYIFF